MKTIALTATAASALLALTGVAHAQSMEAQPYVNLGGTYLTDPEFGAVTGRAGVDLGDYFGLEAEGSLGVEGDTTGVVESEMDHMIAGFARVRAPLSENLEGFVRGGYYDAEYDYESPLGEVEVGDDDFAGGAGLQYNFSQNNGVRLDYTNYGFDDDGHSVSLAYVLGF